MRSIAIAVLISICIVSIAQSKTINVSPDGSGDFKTVQEAIAAVPDDSTEWTTIHLAPGTYQGPVVIGKNKVKISLEGEAAETTIITWSHNVFEPQPQTTDKYNPGMQILADDFKASGITFQNTSGNHGQALAVRIDSDRTIFANCRATGWQDTLLINNGRSYWKDCFIAGRVDFIYGSATVVFDHCEIQSRNGGHVTAASTPKDQPFGFVFMNCKLTSDPTPWAWPATVPTSQPIVDKTTPLADLGRPWRPYASVTYLNCEMGAHINPQGWNNWRNPDNEKTARYSEYNSTGPGANPDKRFAWTKQLTKSEAEAITIEKILGGTDGWNPSEK